MIIIDAGHCYMLGVLDGDVSHPLQFVKREGSLFPGNTGTACGTTLQEVFRACLDRVYYLDEQAPCEENAIVIFNLRSSIYALESRAARRHDRPNPPDPIYGITCARCMHVGCDGRCKDTSEHDEVRSV